jgi:peptidoglycan/xylan/chitin deacetylase (PgdA/CDA1 family)
MEPDRLYSVCLHLDSFAEAAGWPAGFEDPAFGVVLDRLLEVAAKWNIRYSVFVIGKDLESAVARRRIRELADAGHEVGNHSWHHHLGLGGMRPEVIRTEITRAHEAIVAAAGKPPAGFVAPAWSYSKHFFPVLSRLGYRYDASAFPSPLMYAMLGKATLNHLNRIPKLLNMLSRRDWLVPLLHSREPSIVEDGMVELPVPTTAGLIPMATWHTLGFVMSCDRHLRLLRKALSTRRFFYYVIHPADFASTGDLPADYHCSLERLDVGMSYKTSLLNQSLEVLASSGRRQVTMNELSQAFCRSRNRPPGT